MTCDGDVIAFDGREIRVLGERDPGDLPWADLGVDVVIEATGRFRTRADAERHLKAGASKVILSAPSKGSEPVDANVVLGVNFHEVYDPRPPHHHQRLVHDQLPGAGGRRSSTRPWASATAR